LNQSYPNWELLIVNDGSTDKTEQIILSFSDERIKYFKQDNKGVSTARNAGLLEMKGKFFCFLDADDILPVESIEARIKYMTEHTETDMLDGMVLVKDGTLSKILREYRPVYSGQVADRYIRLSEKVFFGPNVFFKKKEPLFFFKEDMTHTEDLMFYTENAWNNQLHYASLTVPVYIYRKTNEGAMANLKAIESGYKKFYTYARRLPGIRAGQLFFLRCRITRIMFLSYLSHKRLGDAFRMSWYLFGVDNA
jgi:glycosyltransferase involved in cell wall biosynthesis